MRNATKLGLEVLEVREVPATLVGLGADRVLRVAADAAGSTVTFATQFTPAPDPITPARFELVVTTTDRGGSRTTRFAAVGIARIEFQGSGAADTATNNTDVIAHMWGGNGNDRLTGGSRGDFLVGGQGNDELDGKGGDDYLFGDGANSFRADTYGALPTAAAQVGGNDVLRGGDGEDLLLGEGGNDRLEGNYGDDRLLGGWGDDMLIGGTGTDLAYGEYGSDTFVLWTGAVTHMPDRTATDRVVYW